MTSRETPELQDLKVFPAQSENPERKVPPELRASLVTMTEEMGRAREEAKGVEAMKK